MKPTKEQIKKYYSEALARCLSAYAQLEEKEWPKKASDHWTAKEHLGHIVAILEQEMLPLTRQALAGEPAHVPGFEKREDTLDFYQKSLEAVRDAPVPQLLQRLQSAAGEHLQMLERLGDTDLDRPAMSPGWDRPGTIRDLFFGAYLFLPAQYMEIRRVNKKKLPHWIEASTPEQVHYHMDRIFHYMPLVFRSDRGADMKATYQFTMEGDGGGQWSIRIADGRAESIDGPAEGFDSELRTQPNYWMDLSMGELNPMWAITSRKVHLGGNPALAMKLSNLFSAEE